MTVCWEKNGLFPCSKGIGLNWPGASNLLMLIKIIREGLSEEGGNGRHSPSSLPPLLPSFHLSPRVWLAPQREQECFALKTTMMIQHPHFCFASTFYILVLRLINCAFSMEWTNMRTHKQIHTRTPLTRNSWWGFNKFPIEMSNHCFTFLCWFHPIKNIESVLLY